MVVETELTQLVAGPIYAHAWNKTRTAVAISPSTEEILIYENVNKKWQLAHTLSEHEQRVTSLDWTTGSDGVDRLLSCSSDRNAYVWTKSPYSSKWEPQLVLLRFKRAANVAKWNPQGNKFAVGGVEGLAAVGHYDAENDWWVCKHLKQGIEGAPILSMDWHPDGNVLAVGTLAGKVHLLTTFLGGDLESKATRRAEWIDQQTLLTFNSELMSINVGSWINAIAFSPSGNALAWANHDAVITILYPATGTQSSLRPLNKDGLSLPFKALLFLSETILMAVGYEPSPVILSGNEKENSWQVKAALTNDQLVSASKLAPVGGAMASKRSIFETASNQGRSAEDMQSRRQVESESVLGHLNTVRAIDSFTDGKVATMGLDGRLIFWSISKLAAQYGLEGIRI